MEISFLIFKIKANHISYLIGSNPLLLKKIKLTAISPRSPDRNSTVKTTVATNGRILGRRKSEKTIF